MEKNTWKHVFLSLAWQSFKINGANVMAGLLLCLWNGLALPDHSQCLSIWHYFWVYLCTCFHIWVACKCKIVRRLGNKRLRYFWKRRPVCHGWAYAALCKGMRSMCGGLIFHWYQHSEMNKPACSKHNGQTGYTPILPKMLGNTHLGVKPWCNLFLLCAVVCIHHIWCNLAACGSTALGD